MAGISWSKDQRQKATADKLCLIALAVDARPAERFGKIEMAKVVPWEVAEKVLDLIEQLVEEP